jgi:hypothetical protein
MIEQKWNRYKQMGRLKSCPLCGDTHIILTRTVTPRRLKKWGLECRYCHCSYSHYLTIRGAIRAWNKATNVSRVREVEGVKIG